MTNTRLIQNHTRDGNTWSIEKPCEYFISYQILIKDSEWSPIYDLLVEHFNYKNQIYDVTKTQVASIIRHEKQLTSLGIQYCWTLLVIRILNLNWNDVSKALNFKLKIWKNRLEFQRLHHCSKTGTYLGRICFYFLGLLLLRY